MGILLQTDRKKQCKPDELYTTARKILQLIFLNHIPEALKFYGEEQPQMVIGYSKELETCYQKNYDQFLNIKYNPAKNMEQADPYFRDGGDSSY